MKLAQINRIRNRDFRNMWYEAIKFVLSNRVELLFGDTKNPKHAFDSIQEMIITGNTLKQVENHVTHPQYQFNGNRLRDYCEMVSRDGAITWQNKKGIEKSTYNYADRLMFYETTFGMKEDEVFDQLENLNKWIKNQQHTKIQTNQAQAITWYVGKDNREKDCPCLQRIWMRWHEGNYLDIHYSWRSRDLFAWPANIIAITEMINQEVVRPNKCRIERIIDYNDSLHIYNYNLEEAMLVKEIQEFHGV
jgi:hypothetical protein